MRHWLQLSTRNWRAKPGRTAASLGAIALGVGVVVWVTCAYESVRLALADQVWFWIGRSHISVESVYGAEGTVYQVIADQVRSVDNIKAVTARLRHEMILQPAGPEAGQRLEVEAVGIDPLTEYTFRDYAREQLDGRALAAGDTDAAVIERQLAASCGLAIGDRFTLRPSSLVSTGAAGGPRTYTVVGIMEHRRVARQQLPVVVVMLDGLQELVGYDGRSGDPKRVTKIDILLDDTSARAMYLTQTRVMRIADAHAQGFLVTTSAAKLRQVEAAERQTGFVLWLVSCVALFTAFFIILSTLSMGMVERMGQLGTLRCLGLTRSAMALLVLAEAVPLGLAGIGLGIPVGLGLARLSVVMAPEYIGHFQVSLPGVGLAVVGGAATTLAGALSPMVQALWVSPLAASRPQSRPAPARLGWLGAACGAAMIWAHGWMVHHVSVREWLVRPQVPLAAVTLLYCGYALVTPLLVQIVGPAAVRLAAGVLRVRPPLLSDQVGRATWRSAAICCGLMVGLSLIVSLVVHSRSLAAGWDFPRDFCEAFVYVSPPVPREAADRARHMPGIASSCLVNESIRCTVQGRGFIHFPISRFVAGDPDEFFRIARLEFVEGDKEQAVARLKQGGHILVTPEFMRAQGFVFGDPKKDLVPIRPAGQFFRMAHFRIAGVVTSPALDIAANYFNAGGMLVSASVYVVLGTFEDARRHFRVPDEVTLFLVNFDLPETEPDHPPEFEAARPPAGGDPQAWAAMLARWAALMPERRTELQAAGLLGPGPQPPAASGAVLESFRQALAGTVSTEWGRMSPAERWHAYREELVMRLLAERAGTRSEQYASVRRLKQQIDRDLRRATLLFTSIPGVSLVVAALGVGNLMTANVASRARQIATLRALGATQWQIVRLVIGEAVVLGALGSLLGLGLGLHAAASMNVMTRSIWGLAPQWTIPWDLVGLGTALTVGVCVIAGIAPARRAARSNIIDALQTT